MMEFRPVVNCAADEETFKSSKLLTFSFLIISDQWYNEKGDLIKCRLKCAFCVTKNLTQAGHKDSVTTSSPIVRTVPKQPNLGSA